MTKHNFSRFRSLAPSGTPIGLDKLTRSVFRAARGEDSQTTTGESIARSSDRELGWMLHSGRASLVIALRAMHQVAGKHRNQVVIPAYTCYSVPAAVQRAGLTPVLCDVDPRSLDFDLDALSRMDFSRVVSIVSANLYGIPNSLGAMESIAQRAGVFLLDDAAQAIGATCDGRLAGGFGDVGIFSFDKGKALPAFHGGAIVCSAGPIAAAIHSQVDKLPSASFLETVASVTKLAAYAIFIRPSLYGMIRHLPILGIGRTEYEPAFPLRTLSSTLSSVVGSMLPDLSEANRLRAASASRLRDNLQGIRGLSLVQPPANTRPTYLRLPVLASNSEERARLLAQLDGSGLGASLSYPKALIDLPEVQRQMNPTTEKFPGSREIAARLFTLPTHAYCPSDLGPAIRDLLLATSLEK